MRRDDAWLLDIVLVCRDVRQFVENVTRDQFLSDKKLQSAVCHKLEIVGEAARAVSGAFQKAHPEILWPDIIGLRNRIVHEYFRLDLAIIWEITQKDIPELIKLIQPLASPLGPSTDS